MKRNLLITAVILAALTLFNVKANAQISPTSPVVATIKIADLYAITLTDLAVEFDYESQAAFSATQAVTKASHITVFSNRKYKIDVHASDDFKIGSSTTNVISAGVLQVSVATPASAPSGTTYTSRFLTATDQNLVNLAPAALAAAYDIKYAIPDVTGVLGKPAGTYTTTIIYTLTQQ